MKRSARKWQRNEFRKHKPSGHPGYIFNQEGNFYEYIGITHNPGEGRNIPLSKNPEPGNTTQSYIKPMPEIDRTNQFGAVKPNWKFDDKDKAKVERVKKKRNVKK